VRRFPIHSAEKLLKDEGFSSPKSVPFEVVAKHERQCQINHGQSAERLAERGGLSWRELWCVLADLGWNKQPESFKQDRDVFLACCNMIVRELDELK
jgi:hypothetical protein